MRYLITGATGYIGSMLVKNLLLQSNEENQINVVVRDINKAKKMLPEKVKIFAVDLNDTQAVRQLNGSYDYIIHCASITKSSEMLANPVEVIESIVNTTQNVLELAKRCNVKSMVYLSSMEVYGNIDCSDGHRVEETQLGDLNIFNVRSCYPMAKRMVENICFCYYKEYRVPVKIARLAQTFGAGILPTENRVFAQFARAAYNNENIVLHTEGNSMGNYCDIQDAVNGILCILQKGVAGEAYNVVNEANTMTIRQMAELVAQKIAHGNIQVTFDIPEKNQYGYAAETGLRLSGEKLRKLGWKPVKGLEEMYVDVLQTMYGRHNIKSGDRR